MPTPEPSAKAIPIVAGRAARQAANRRIHNAVLHVFDISRISLGNRLVQFVAEHVRGDRAAMGVRRGDHDVGRRDAGLLLDSPADALGRLAADEDDVVGRKQEPTITVGEKQGRTEQRVVNPCAVAADMRIAEQELRFLGRNVADGGAGNKTSGHANVLLTKENSMFRMNISYHIGSDCQ